MNYTYTLENESDTIIVEGELSNYPNTTFGEESSFEFYIRESEIDSRGYGLDYGSSYGGLEHRTASERYQTLKQYLKYAGYSVAERTQRGVYFNEQSGFDRAPIDTLLISVQPHEDIEEIRGIWGVIMGGSDSTEVFGAQARIDLEVFVLAEYDDYDSEQDVRDAFEYQL